MPQTRQEAVRAITDELARRRPAWHIDVVRLSDQRDLVDPRVIVRLRTSPEDPSTEVHESWDISGEHIDVEELVSHIITTVEASGPSA